MEISKNIGRSKRKIVNIIMSLLEKYYLGKKVLLEH